MFLQDGLDTVVRTYELVVKLDLDLRRLFPHSPPPPHIIFPCLAFFVLGFFFLVSFFSRGGGGVTFAKVSKLFPVITYVLYVRMYVCTYEPCALDVAAQAACCKARHGMAWHGRRAWQAWQTCRRAGHAGCRACRASRGYVEYGTYMRTQVL